MTLRIAVAGLVHGHARGFFARAKAARGVEIAGVAEKDETVASRYFRDYELAPSLYHREIEALLDDARPDVVAGFCATPGQLPLVRAALARKIPVMLEKPLGSGVEDATEIARLSRESGVPVVVNYETTWYPNTAALFDDALRRELGAIRRLVFRTGHRGPQERGAPPEFVRWLADPAAGGGVILDFGCYGVQLAHALLGGKPRTVLATAQTWKTEPPYGAVEDEATIVLAYPRAQVVVQASWNWAVDRKEWELHGEHGAIASVGRDDYVVRDAKGERRARVPAGGLAERGPFALLGAAARDGTILPAYAEALSSAGVNRDVSEVLAAARTAARTARGVDVGVDVLVNVSEHEQVIEHGEASQSHGLRRRPSSSP